MRVHMATHVACAACGMFFKDNQALEDHNTPHPCLDIMPLDRPKTKKNVRYQLVDTERNVQLRKI